MKSLLIPKVDSAEGFFRKAEKRDSPYESHKIEFVNWPEYPYRPYASFAIAHTGGTICLTFFVDEKYTRASVTEDNGRVCADSCVEFFIAFDQAGYYNLEHNCIGTALLKYRTDQQNVELAGAGVLQSLVRIPSLGNEPFAEKTEGQAWQLALEIPGSLFFRNTIEDFSGMEARGNFYKCGDELTSPHYLSWNPVANPTPNFHLRECFGRLVFGR